MSRPETTIYRSDHILGKVDELTPDLYRSWGRTLGHLSHAQGGISVGSDCRESSQTFRAALKAGIVDVGIRVLDLGIVPIVGALFSLHVHDVGGTVYVSGLGTPPTFNGLRWILTDSPQSLQEQCQALRREAEQGLTPLGIEQCKIERDHSFLQDWIDWHQRIWFDTPKTPLRVIVDPLHGSWSRLLRRALQVIFPMMLFEAIHDEPDPQYGGLVPCALNSESIKQLCREVDIGRADMGIAIDGETGSISFCDDHGIPLTVHELSWLMLQSYATAIPGEKVLHTTACPEIFIEEIKRLGGSPVLAPISNAGFIGHMQETNAIIGFDHRGRYFGRSCFGQHLSFFAICWLIDYLARRQIRLSEFRRTVPPCFATQELKTPWAEPKDVANLLKAKWNVKPEKTIDGLRFSGANGHMSLREDRDYVQLAFQFEAKSWQMLDQIIEECVSALNGTAFAKPLSNAMHRVSSASLDR